jgi:hypothetical protein
MVTEHRGPVPGIDPERGSDVGGRDFDARQIRCQTALPTSLL